jgi:hypothetical protein
MNINTEMLEKSTQDLLLEKFKPLLIVYMPDEMLLSSMVENKLMVTIKKLEKETNNMYLILVIPSHDECIKLDILSVIKNDFIRDTDLEKYIERIQSNLLDLKK